MFRLIHATIFDDFIPILLKVVFLVILHRDLFSLQPSLHQCDDRQIFQV